MWAAINKKNLIIAVSENPFTMTGHEVVEIPTKEPKSEWHKLVGKHINKEKTKDKKDLRVAFICNWNDTCGISTYSKYLADAIIPKVSDFKVFSEVSQTATNDESYVLRCWKRGESLQGLIKELSDWKPDFVIVQHEFGIFPKATYFLQLLQGLEDVPHVITLHSVYEHLDKAVCSAAIKNIVVHSNEGRDVLKRLGNNNNIYVIPHGCVEYPASEKEELWNIFQNPYTIVQFGFGFFYKGVDKVLDAIHYLKNSDPKFKDIFYCYLCSDNLHTSVVHAQYHEYLLNKIETLGLQDNAVIIRKYQTEQTINQYLRTAKLAVFPYVGDKKNMVYGASGAIRVAMACGICVIASDCHQFDDLDGVVPRPGDYIALAKEIDEVFSSESYRSNLIAKANKYISDNTWSISADRYLDLYYKV